MSIKFDPFFSESEKDVRDLSRDFLTKNGLNYFQYATIYEDNTSRHLVTHQDFIQERANRERRVLSHTTPDLINRNTYMFLWNESLPVEDTNLAREFNLDKGICLVERFKSHYNLIAFASPSSNDPLNFYLNNKGKLLNFISEFKDKASHLLDKSYENRYTLPESYQDKNKDQLILGKNFKRSFIHNEVQFFLSEREFSCLNLFSKGFTMNIIGEALELSPRTVETYLNRVREKSGILSRKELVKLAAAIL